MTFDVGHIETVVILATLLDPLVHLLEDRLAAIVGAACLVAAATIEDRSVDVRNAIVVVVHRNWKPHLSYGTDADTRPAGSPRHARACLSSD